MIDLDKLKEVLGDLEDDDVTELVEEFMSTNPNKEEAYELMKAAQEGMAIVGNRFEKGDYFVGDLIFAGELLSEILDEIKPILGGESQDRVTGTIVLGTVKGDLHNIGKNIFKVMAQAEGFEVYDLGIDQPVDAFVEKVKEVKPDIVGMSGVLTLALDAMRKTVDGLAEAGLRDDIKIIIGGNPVTKDASSSVGADAYTTSAVEGLSICKEWVQK